MGRGTVHGGRRRSVDFESLWLITFADLMVQLMAFFAVIFSFSMKDQRDMNLLLESFKKEVGLASKTKAPAGAPVSMSAPMLVPKPVEGGKAADLESLLSDLRAMEGPNVGKKMRLVTFRGSVLFGEGSSALDPTFDPLLERISRLAIDYPGFYLVCEGYAAPGEKSRAGGDALELSGQRAQAVARRLIDQGVNPALISAEAKGDALLEGNPDTPEGRALQRRVAFRYQRPSEK